MASATGAPTPAHDHGEGERAQGRTGEGARTEAAAEESEEEAMSMKVSELRGDDVLARDGSVGTLHDVYFDDAGWVVRYMVVDTGRWVPGQRILIAPDSVEGALSDPGKLRVGATLEQLRAAPGADDAPPVAEQQRLATAKAFGPPYYWTSPALWAAASAGGSVEATAGDPHLRSSVEVIGYDVEARDGPAGRIEDIVIDAATWRIQDLVVDTTRWWPGGEVRVHPQYVERIDWAERKVRLLLTQEQVKRSGEAMPRR